LLVPLAGQNSVLAFTGDMILFAYLFGLARFFTTSAALDTGSAFEGMGSSREVTFAVLTEPALFFAFLTLIRITGNFELNGMLRTASNFLQTDYVPSVVLVSIGLFIVLLAETCRIPVDDPNTHLELTMIHEAMVLDHSGPLFGIISYSAAVKLFVLGSVLLNIALPFRTGILWADWLVFTGEILGLAFIVGILESITARLQMRRVPYLLVTAFLLCGSSFILLLR
jgi:formate hydrogenlyase subunit 4